MSSPREAQLPLLLSISEGLSRGTDEMLRVSPQGDAIHPPSCSLAIRESVEEIKWLRAEAERLTRERDEARAEVERQAHHIEELREKIDVEKSCACALDAPGDVCVAHSPALMQARAEVERLTEWQSINHSEQHKLGWSMTEFCEGKRDHLHEMWERPPSLDYGIAHIEAEIKRLRAEVERLRGALTMAAGYVRYCHDAWHETRDLAEAWRDLTKIRAVLNDERAGELEAKP